MISRTRKRGFTLIEVLAAMAILSILMLILTRIFAETTKAWDLGTADSESNIAGRAVVEFIVRDVSQAFADEGVEFRIRSDALPVYGYGSDILFFASLDVDPDAAKEKRASGLVIYYLAEMKDANGDDTGRYRLMRSFVSNFTSTEMQKLYDAGNDWTSSPNLSAPQPIADNVTAFELWAYRDPVSAASSGAVPNYHSSNYGGQLPAWLDIYVEVLSDQDAVRAALLDSGGNQAALDELLDQRAKGYQARAYFRNRAGYLWDR